MSSGGGAQIFVVGTPIGNLEDLTPRAQKVLAGADIIAAEDTRETKKLLSHLGITGKRLYSYQDHGEAARAEQLIKTVLEGQLSLALVTDAGTPCISDPGYRLVAAAKAAGIPVHPIPGASALTALASAAGLPTDRLLFVGFLPTKESAMKTEIESWRTMRASIVFFESTRRLDKTLHRIGEIYPEAQLSIGRELTKLFEEIVTLDLPSAKEWLSSHKTLKGEATVMVHLPESARAVALPDSDDLETEALDAFVRGATLKDLLIAYKDRGLKRPALYQLLLRAKQRQNESS